MPLTLISGPANAGKAQAVMDEVRRRARRRGPAAAGRADGLGRAALPRELAGGGALIGARVTRFGGLLGEVVRRSGNGEAGAGRACPRALDRARQPPRGAAAPGDEPLSDGLSRAVRELLEELHTGDVTPARLRRRWTGSTPADPGEGPSRRRLAELLCGL